ncbi:MAG: hypothetical protein PHX18_02000 [Candidatus Gastranaerophilales bacterium]|nr:hypothetical protein [Candidatus Gastranaerophilales bacterium]
MSLDKQEVLKSKAREVVGNLIYNVIARQMTALEALKLFPKSVEDDSIKVAWHALVHFEADEDLQSKDKLYYEQQFLYLELIAKILAQGKNMPQNMLDEYIKYHGEIVLPKKNSVFDKLKNLFRFID